MNLASTIMNAPTPYWWEDCRNVAELFDWLRGDECPEDDQTLDCDDADAVSEFLNRPWKWAPEYERMRAIQIAKTPTAPPPEDMPSCRR